MYLCIYTTTFIYSTFISFLACQIQIVCFITKVFMYMTFFSHHGTHGDVQRVLKLILIQAVVCTQCFRQFEYSRIPETGVLPITELQ